MTMQGQDWVRVRLAERRLSQRQLAKLIGLDASAVSLMLRGKRKMGAEEAAAISRLLNVDVDDLIGHLRTEGALGAGANAGSGQRADRGKGSARKAAAVAGSGAGVDGGSPRDVTATGEIEEIMLPVPLISGGFARVFVPVRLSKADAERISAVVCAVSVGQKE